ncbi:THUMP domain-containing class I SAM-dependent RNA methyltransferase [Bacteroides thetaiotaomicron]|uniref:THUMP domain-containing class I SAM-dependent RNA methyltransferase n=1 Tax=Bacteroides thetaiotaomicron TaxID=818 RepID=UPI001F286959|nr:THUMP domain-containing protein [Bacteroides thetaiotaomicron]MCE8489119.1 RNA methyltransferase [Bacteroides thetaiotaomicron]
MSEQFEMIAKTFQGLEEILAEELTTLGANDIQIGRRMVSFTGDKRMMYKANFCLRTAIRILKPIKNFTAKDADEVYNQIQAIPWEEYLDVNKTFAIDAVVFSEEFRHSKFVSYKVKDAIVDYFRKKTGKRPSVRINNPDVLLNIHIAQTTCTLSLDSSGESLHRRGYRQEQVDAPLNEVLAAGMLLMTGWRGECDLIDPMCGSGTIPIEAALIARNIAPGVFRKGFAFEKWVDFDSEMFDEIYNDDSQEREFTHKIYGYDNNPKANEIATHNIKAAGVSKDVTLKLQPFQQFEQPQEKSIIVMNPPYGERISTNDLLGLYQMIGERLKHAFVGNEAWVLSYREECFDQIGLKPSKKVPLFNGALECEFRKYEIFDGKYKEFKSQEGEGEEKKETEGNYDTSRPRERKEFKPRGEGEFKPRREGEFKPRREGDFKPRREEGSFTRDDRDRKPRGEFRGERDSRAPREFRGNREPRIPKKEEE